MRKFLVAGVTAVAALTMVGANASASADPAPTGKIIVYSHELTEVTEWENPQGCQKLPIDAHVLINDSERTVQTFGDPLCLMPNLTVKPGYGAHVAAGTGSFSVQK